MSLTKHVSYKELINDSYRKSLNEKKDCSVISVALACNISYSKAHSLLAKQGRTNQCSMANAKIKEVIKSQNMTLTKVKSTQKNGARYTPISIVKEKPTGKYLLFGNGHVMVLNEGVVEDWTAGRRNHINIIFRVS